MSNLPNLNPNNMMSSELRPEHHPHDSSEPLPGAGGRRGPDYGVENTDTSSGLGSGTRLQDRLGGFQNDTTGRSSDFNSGNMDTSAQPQDRLNEFGSGTAGGMRGTDPSFGEMDRGSGFGGSQAQDRLNEFGSGTTGGMRGTNNMNTGSGFGGGAQTQDRLGDFGSGTTGGMRGTDNMDTGSGFGGGAQTQDRSGEFGSDAAGGRRGPDFSDYKTETMGTGFGDSTQRQDRSSEFGRSGLDTGTGVDKPAKVNFEDQVTRDYDPSSNDTSTAASGKPEMFRATEDTSTGTHGVGRRDREPAVTEPTAGDDTTGASQGRKGMFMATEGTAPETRDTQGGTGVGRHEHDSTTKTKPSVTDKIAGGTQKLVGKMTKNPDMQEKGELRETGGKAAVN